jgi:hypothetical protein
MEKEVVHRKGAAKSGGSRNQRNTSSKDREGKLFYELIRYADLNIADNYIHCFESLAYELL